MERKSGRSGLCNAANKGVEYMLTVDVDRHQLLGLCSQEHGPSSATPGQ